MTGFGLYAVVVNPLAPLTIATVTPGGGDGGGGSGGGGLGGGGAGGSGAGGGGLGDGGLGGCGIGGTGMGGGGAGAAIVTTIRTSPDGALIPHSLLARTRTKYVPAATPLAVSLVSSATSRFARFAVPGADPASSTYDAAPGTPFH